VGEDLSESAFVAEIGIRVASCPGTLKGYLTRLQHTEGHTARLRRAQTCPPHDSSYEKSWSISRDGRSSRQSNLFMNRLRSFVNRLPIFPKHGRRLCGWNVIKAFLKRETMRPFVIHVT